MEQVGKFQSMFNLTDFHSRPSNKIYAAYFMYPAVVFRLSIYLQIITISYDCLVCIAAML